MPASLDCVLCLARQALEAARHASDDPKVHEAVMRRVFEILQQKGFTHIPPLVAQEIQRVVREQTGNDDPYRKQKDAANRQMLEQLPLFRERMHRAADPMEAAVRLAIAGNSIDNALAGHLSDEYIQSAINHSLTGPLHGSIEAFKRGLDRAASILYLTDNCGEIVCDRLLIEEILKQHPKKRIKAVVRAFPVINDATYSDAEQVGLTELVPVIDNGNDAVGTVLEQCGPAFHEALREADLVIAKGLANYETLVEYDRTSLPVPVLFLFKSKCPFIASYSGTRLGELVIIQKPDHEEKAA